MQARELEHVQRGACKEPEVLEYHQCGQRDGNSKGQQRFSGRRTVDELQASAHARGEKRNTHEQGKETPIPECIETVARQQQQHLVRAEMPAQGPGGRENTEQKYSVLSCREEQLPISFRAGRNRSIRRSISSVEVRRAGPDPIEAVARPP